MLKSKSLHLNRVEIDRNLVRSLPAEIAIHYQAIPVCSDGEQITVAMADPEDSEASKAVISAIGAPTCLVQVDSLEIQRLLAEFWPQNPPPRLRVLYWSVTGAQENQPYPQQLAIHLNAEIKTISIPWDGEKSINNLVTEAKHYHPDLIMFQLPEPGIIPQLLLDFTLNKLIERLPASILLFKKPCWPLKKLLLVLRDGHDIFDSAVDWIIRLAKHSQTSVTILPLLPPVPEMYGPSIQHSLPALLSGNDPLGQKMRQVALRLSSEQIEGTFKLRNVPPLEQLRDEVSEEEIDLVAITAKPQNCFGRWLFGELINDLFSWFDRPLLITKPFTQ
jgi:nucleotide-binding universal stress UspA family protein